MTDGGGPAGDAGEGTVAPDPSVEREVHGLRAVIDRDLCVGFGDCIEEAPEAFDLDEDGVAVFTGPEHASRKRFIEACASCPVDAITVLEDGIEIVP
ncbi:MAG: ferredoxin [Gemmatimonadales bacterium]|nr:ferredoxin [Gemmatimonadales bacterium]MXX78846.1 ferredoxin [Gemmatimonadales bacterium]MYC89123.1 ferredoxin [Candidatus Palauibacter denitrificans]